MHVLGLVGSIRKNKITHALVSRVIDEIERQNKNTTSEAIFIADYDIQPCKVICSNYCSNHPFQCTITDDVADILNQMIQADALVIGTPLYFRVPPAKFHTFVERLISVFFFNETQGKCNVKSLLAQKPCGLIGVAEYTNPHGILEYLIDFITSLNMKPILLDKFPYLGVAGQGEISNDKTFKPYERVKDLAWKIEEEIKTIS